MSAVGYPMALASASLGMRASARHLAAYDAAIYAWWMQRSATNNHDENQIGRAHV